MNHKIRIRQTRQRLWVDWIWLGLIMVLALFLRCYWQYDVVFVQNHIIFREADPYLHARLAEVIASNFPFKPAWDYYALYPSGAMTYPPVLAYIIATIAWIIGLGNPSIHLVDTVGVWLPPVLAALTCIVVYFLGKVIFKSRIVGLIGALIISIVPSEFFHRSMLGFIDHHILEVLLSSLCLLLLILATKTRKLCLFLLAGLTLIVYCLNWIGWPLFVSVLVGYGLYKLIRWIWQRNKKYEQVATLSMFGMTLLIIAFSKPLQWMAFSYLSNTFLGFTGTIQEVRPTSLYDYYVLYNLAGFLCIGGIWLAMKNKLNGLFLAWGIFIIVAAIAEKRWGYYAVIPIALFAGYFIKWLCMADKQWIYKGANKFCHFISESVKWFNISKDWKPYILAFLIFVLMFMTTMYTLGIAKRGNDISQDWYNTCLWLRYNTPEPFENPDAYYQLDSGPASYGVLSWWDYGHYIIQIGHRVPVSSPTQQESQYYKFFTSENENEANKVIENTGIAYVVIDNYMVDQKYYAIYNKVFGTANGWHEQIKSSMVYKMYNGQSETWKMVKKTGSVKIFERVENGNN